MVDSAAVKKQVEYYLSDTNLKGDEFFHSKISADPEGWLDITFLLNCNKIKILKAKAGDIAKAVADSKTVELSPDKKKLRRKGNKELPALSKGKRQAKASSKEEEKKQKGEEEKKEEAPGELREVDYQNPLIVHFETEEKADDKKGGFKTQWKDIEAAVKERYPSLKLLYSRADEHHGQFAFSTVKLDKAALEKLMNDKVESQGRTYTFKKLEGQELKDFWQK